MGSIWLSKKAFLYFGGTFIILLGGAIVLMSPYNYVNYALVENSTRTFIVKGESGYYPQLEISASVRPSNTSTVHIDMMLIENVTLDTYVVNMTLTSDDKVIGPDTTIYEQTVTIPLPVGNYTFILDNLDGVGQADIGLNQVSDSRVWIVSGGSLNIIGVVMGIAGYLVPGTFLPTDSDTIIDWGYDEEEESPVQ
ncbi:MAG: hypothetical protein ACP6KW_02730 [Candidatus Thorarchaeota archaeon]